MNSEAIALMRRDCNDHEIKTYKRRPISKCEDNLFLLFFQPVIIYINFIFQWPWRLCGVTVISNNDVEHNSIIMQMVRALLPYGLVPTGLPIPVTVT